MSETFDPRAVIDAEITRWQARARAWQALGVTVDVRLMPHAAAYGFYGQLGCSLCGHCATVSEEVPLKPWRAGAHLRHSVRTWLTWVHVSWDCALVRLEYLGCLCPHLAPLKGPVPEAWEAAYGLELLAGVGGAL